MLTINSKKVDVTMFPDGTSQVWKLDPFYLTKADFVLIEWDFEHEGEFMHLAQIKILLDHYGVDTALKLRYPAYGRQDKPVHNNKTFALRAFAEQINNLAFPEVIILDPHSHVYLEVIRNSRAVYCSTSIRAAIELEKSNLICYPDHGALEKYSSVYPYFTNFISAVKERDQETGQIKSLKLAGSCLNKRVMIVDDICDGGATFIALAELLLSEGATSVSLFVTHGIFSKGRQILLEAGITNIYTGENA